MGARHLPNGQRDRMDPGFQGSARVELLAASVASKVGRPGLSISPFLSHFLLFWVKEPATWSSKALSGLKLKDSKASRGVLQPGSWVLCRRTGV